MRIEKIRKQLFSNDILKNVLPALEYYEMEEMMKEKMNGDNTLGQLNIELFSQLHRLRSVDVNDNDALKSEIERSKAVEGISRTIIDNAKIIVEATKMRAAFQQSANVPKMLEG